MTDAERDAHLDGIIDAVRKISAERKMILRDMKQAIQEDRLRDALLHACKLVGIEPTDAIKLLKGE